MEPGNLGSTTHEIYVCYAAFPFFLFGAGRRRDEADERTIFWSCGEAFWWKYFSQEEEAAGEEGFIFYLAKELRLHQCGREGKEGWRKKTMWRECGHR